MGGSSAKGARPKPATASTQLLGITKAAANYVAGTWSDRFGRKPVLVAGWLVALPVVGLLPFVGGMTAILFGLGVGAGVAAGSARGDRQRAAGVGSVAAVAGMAFALLLTFAFVLTRLAVPEELDQPVTDAMRGSLVLALNLLPFAGIAFLWFMGVVRDRIGQREDRFFGTVFLGSGLLFIAMLFATGAIAVVQAGRPPCPQCGAPLEPTGHFCPRRNGYSH